MSHTKGSPHTLRGDGISGGTSGMPVDPRRVALRHLVRAAIRFRQDRAASVGYTAKIEEELCAAVDAFMVVGAEEIVRVNLDGDAAA